MRHLEEPIRLAAMIFILAVVPAFFGLIFYLFDWIFEIVLTFLPEILFLITSVAGFFLIIFYMNWALSVTEKKKNFRRYKPNNQQKKYDLLHHKLTAIVIFYKDHYPEERIDDTFNYLLNHYETAYRSKDHKAALEDVNTLFLHELQLIETIFSHLDNQLVPATTVLAGIQELVTHLRILQNEESTRLNDHLQAEINIFKDLNKA